MGGLSSGPDRFLGGRRRTIVVAIAVIALLAIPAAYVAAYDTFSDVPTSAFYHNSVNALLNAGVTSGCGAGKYCPNNAVTRGQMAVFLDRLGNLSGGPFDQVVDALTVLGQIVLADVEEFGITTAAGVATQCVTSGNLLPVVPDEAFSYSVVHQLRDIHTPDIPTQNINVSIEDPDETDGEYDVCFRTFNGSDLPTGTYVTSWWIAGTIGSGIFGSASKNSSVSKFREAYKK